MATFKIPENRQAAVKATEIAFSDLSTGARLPEQRAAEFLVRVREKATMKDMITVAPINDSGKLIAPWAEVPENVMGLAQGLKNPADYLMHQMTTGDEEIETFDVECIVFIKDDWRRGNFQGEGGVDLALDMFATQFAANMEQAALYSNTLGPAILESDLKEGGSSSQYVKFDVRSQANGWLERMEDGGVVDGENSDDISAVFGEMLLEYPTRYEQYMSQLKWFVPPRLDKVMQMNLANRETGLGDLARNGKIQNSPWGIDTLPVPLLLTNPPEVEHITLTGTTPVALEYKPILASNLKILPSTLGSTATTPYINGTDYNFTSSTAEVVRPSSGSNISSGATVKAFYKTGTKAFLTFPGNLVMGLTRNIEIEPWRYAPGAGTFYIIRAKMGWGFLIPGAVVLGKNIKAEPQVQA